MNHTPGPWHRNVSCKYPVYAEGGPRRFTYIANVLTDNEGDLNLITAAPDMSQCLIAAYHELRIRCGYKIGDVMYDEIAKVLIAAGLSNEVEAAHRTGSKS